MQSTLRSIGLFVVLSKNTPKGMCFVWIGSSMFYLVFVCHVFDDMNSTSLNCIPVAITSIFGNESSQKEKHVTTNAAKLQTIEYSFQLIVDLLRAPCGNCASLCSSSHFDAFLAHIDIFHWEIFNEMHSCLAYTCSGSALIIDEDQRFFNGTMNNIHEWKWLVWKAKS